MALSIFHRVTGFGLAVGAAVLTWGLLAAVSGEPAFNAFHKLAHTFVGQALLFGWVFAFVYHFFNGIRHLVWDTGRWLDLKSAYASGWFVVFVSLVCSVGFWLWAVVL